MDTRQGSYKSNSINTIESRLRRHEVTVELRKSKKDDQMFKRRNINEDDITSPIKQPQSPVQLTIEEIVECMNSTDPEKQFLGMQSTRRMLSRERNPPIDLMIGHGIVPICVNFLKKHENSQLQFEAAWALTNIASGNSEQTSAVIDNSGVPCFIELMYSKNFNLAEQAVWALGNIAGDGPVARDIVIQHKVIDAILRVCNVAPLPVTYLRNVAWLMSNLCRNKNPAPPFNEIRRILPILCNMLSGSDAQVLADVCWALSYVTDDENKKIQAVVDTGVVPLLVGLLSSDEPSIIVPALRSVGNIVTGTDQQTDSVICCGGLPLLSNLLRHTKPNIVKEAAWTVSNVTAGNYRQIQAVIDADIFKEIRTVLSTGDFKSQKEAAWAVTNATTSGTLEQIMDLIEKYEILKPFCALLDAKDSRTVKVVLNGIGNILSVAKRVNNLEAFCIMIEEVGALDKLEALQRHENEEIYNKAYSIVETFFTCDNGEEFELGPQQVGDEMAFDVQKHPVGNFKF